MQLMEFVFFMVDLDEDLAVFSTGEILVFWDLVNWSTMELMEFVFFMVDLDEDLAVFLTGEILDEEDILAFFVMKKEDLEDIMQHTK